MKRCIECVLIAFLFGTAPLVFSGEDAGTIRIAGCRIKPAEQITLSVNQSGILDSVPREGDQIEAGQRVILLQNELARASLAVAEAEAANDVDIAYADTRGIVALQEYEQAIQANITVKGSLTDTDVRRRKLELDQCLLQYKLAKYKQAVAFLKRDEAAAHLKSFQVTAPIAGTVNKVLKHKGEAVRQGEAVLEMVNTRRVRVEGYLDAVHRRRVRPGIVVSVDVEPQTDESTFTSIAGKIIFVDTVVQPVTRQVRFWADVDNADEALLPGLTAVLTVPPEHKIPTAPRMLHPAVTGRSNSPQPR